MFMIDMDKRAGWVSFLLRPSQSRQTTYREMGACLLPESPPHVL